MKAIRMHDAASRAVYGPTFTHNARGVTDPLRPCGPSFGSTARGLMCGVRLPKTVTFRRGDAAAARAVIGPLTETPRRTETQGSRLRRSVCVA